jgi:hypothetical protein
MTVLRAFLVVCVLAVVGASADASASSPDTGTWTLTVTFAGTGRGLVTTFPAGILCTDENPETPVGTVPQPLGTCSAQFPVGVAPTVIATASGGPSLGRLNSTISAFGGFSGDCSGSLEKQPGSCQATQDDPTDSVQVTFSPKPIPCTVNRVVDQPLAQAKRNLRERGCKVGTVRYAYSTRNENFGEVISQNPKAHWQLPHGAVGAVDLVVSKGRRGP